MELHAGSAFSLERSESWVDTVSSWLVIATIPETVAHRMVRVEPTPAEMVWRACGLRLGLGWGQGEGYLSFRGRPLRGKQGGEGAMAPAKGRQVHSGGGWRTWTLLGRMPDYLGVWVEPQSSDRSRGTVAE